MSRRTLMPILGVAAAAILVVGLIQSGGGDGGGQQPAEAARPYDTPAEQQAALRGAPEPLAALHADAGAIRGGGKAAFERQIDALDGYPVVVNKWASWCGPCRFEFPIFQAASSTLGKRVAFLGLNSGDNRQAAGAFLTKRPVPYPSFEDGDEKIARSVEAGGYYPITIFYGPDGKRTYTHAGPYKTVAALEADIAKYGS
jgi:cytochrome c biogenesis protein CcmG/thiol:disulfide interchange protein DsbE